MRIDPGIATGTFDCLISPIAAKGVDFKLACELRVDVVIKVTSYFKSVGSAGVDILRDDGEDNSLFCAPSNGI